jgi:hypothetical protein
LNPTIDEEYWNFINETIKFIIKIPEGYNEPDYYFIKLVIVIDDSQKETYHPSVLLKFQDSFDESDYTVIVRNNFTYIAWRF